MRKVLGFTLIFSGTIICIFVFNIILYSAVPSYRNVLASAVSSDDDIPVVTANGESVVMPNEQIPAAAAPDSSVKETEYYDTEADICNAEVAADNEEKDALLINADAESDHANSSDDEEGKPEEAPRIVDKTYHEDCGTGAGYWVITYSDGSVGLE